MTGVDSNGIRLGRFRDSNSFVKLFNKTLSSDLDNIVFLCIGTDRSTGDSLAPLIGTLLEKNGFKNVIGTIEFPVHAQNLDERLKELPRDKTVVAIDSCLGNKAAIGSWSFSKGQLHPGRGLGKTLTPVGDYTLAGVVNVQSSDPYINFQKIQSTRLHTVLTMAETLVDGLKEIQFANKNSTTLKIVN